MFDFLDIVDVELEEVSVDTTKWRRCFFDLEGSLDTGGDILQVATITTDWDLNILDVYNSYYKNYKPISEKEFSVHGISEEFVDKVAAGHFTELYDKSPLITEHPTMFVSYTTFDIKRITEELKSYNLPLVPFGTEVPTLVHNMNNTGNCYFNAYSYGKKRGVVLASEIGESEFDTIYEEMAKFGEFSRKSNHDALFDSVMILALCRRFLNERHAK